MRSEEPQLVMESYRDWHHDESTQSTCSQSQEEEDDSPNDAEAEGNDEESNYQDLYDGRSEE